MLFWSLFLEGEGNSVHAHASHVGVTHVWNWHSHVGVTHVLKGPLCVGVTHVLKGPLCAGVTHMLKGPLCVGVTHMWKEPLSVEVTHMWKGQGVTQHVEGAPKLNSSLLDIMKSPLQRRPPPAVADPGIFRRRGRQPQKWRHQPIQFKISTQLLVLKLLWRWSL